MTRILKKIHGIYESLGKRERDRTFYDVLELGVDESAKAHLFRKLQDVAQDKGLKLDKQEGLIDPITNMVHIDKDNEDPVESLFKMLDLDSLIGLPIRTLEIKDIVKAVERKDKSVDTPDDVNDYSMNVVLSYNNKKVDVNAMTKLFNNLFDQLQTTIAGAGRNKDDERFTFKYKVFAPKDVTVDELRTLIQQNRDMFTEYGIKTVDVTES